MVWRKPNLSGQVGVRSALGMALGGLSITHSVIFKVGKKGKVCELLLRDDLILCFLCFRVLRLFWEVALLWLSPTRRGYLALMFASFGFVSWVVFALFCLFTARLL